MGKSPNRPPHSPAFIRDLREDLGSCLVLIPSQWLSRSRPTWRQQVDASCRSAGMLQKTLHSCNEIRNMRRTKERSSAAVRAMSHG